MKAKKDYTVTLLILLVLVAALAASCSVSHYNTCPSQQRMNKIR